MVKVERDAVFTRIGVVVISAAVEVPADAVTAGGALRAPPGRVCMVRRERLHVAQKVDRRGIAPFDPDHLRAEGREDARRLRPDLQPGQVDDPYAVERPPFSIAVISHASSLSKLCADAYTQRGIVSGPIPNASFPNMPSESYPASGWIMPPRTSRYICSSGPAREMAAPPAMRIALSTTLAAVSVTKCSQASTSISGGLARNEGSLNAPAVCSSIARAALSPTSISAAKNWFPG